MDVMRQNRKLQWKEREARKAAMVKDSANVGKMPGAINDGPSSDPASTDAPSSDSPTNAHSGDAPSTKSLPSSAPSLDTTPIPAPVSDS